jgi:hypothetical protein
MDQKDHPVRQDIAPLRSRGLPKAPGGVLRGQVSSNRRRQAMTGIQKTIADALAAISADVRTGKYGEGDDVDVDSICEDIEEMTDQF